MSRRILLMGRSGCGKTSLIKRIHEITKEPPRQLDSSITAHPNKNSNPNPGVMAELPKANKTQAAEYHSDFIDVPGEYLEVRSFYRALIMLTCQACAIMLIQAADDEENLYPSGLARTFNKPVVGVVTKTDIVPSEPNRAETILREAGASRVFFTSALTAAGLDGLIKHLDILTVHEKQVT